jgi:hypothetical protein
MLRGNEYLSNSSSEVSSSENSDDQKSGKSSQKLQYKFRKNKEDRKSISSCNLIETSNGLLGGAIASYEGSVNDEIKSENLNIEPRRKSQQNNLTSDSLNQLDH